MGTLSATLSTMFLYYVSVVTLCHYTSVWSWTAYGKRSDLVLKFLSLQIYMNLYVTFALGGVSSNFNSIYVFWISKA